MKKKLFLFIIYIQISYLQYFEDNNENYEEDRRYNRSYGKKRQCKACDCWNKKSCSCCNQKKGLAGAIVGGGVGAGIGYAANAGTGAAIGGPIGLAGGLLISRII